MIFFICETWALETVGLFDLRSCFGRGAQVRRLRAPGVEVFGSGSGVKKAQKGAVRLYIEA